MKSIILQVGLLISLLITPGAKAQIVSTFAGSGSSGSSNGTATGASFNKPIAVCSDASGNIYVADYINNLIRKITPAGVVSTFAGSGSAGSSNGTGTAASFFNPIGVCSDASGNIYVADRGNHLIRKITPGGVVSTFAGSGSAGSSNGTGTAASFNGPTGLCIDAAGNLYVSESYSHLIRKITSAGVVSTLAGSGSSGSSNGTGTAASFYGPSAVCSDASGNIYVADYANQLIRKITPAGVVSTLAGSGSIGSSNGTGTAASFYNPSGVCSDAAGNIYVADLFNHLIRKITSAGVVSTVAGSGSFGSTNGTGTSASFFGPAGVCIDATGNIYVTDRDNNLIRKIELNAAALNFDGVNDYVVLPVNIGNTLSNSTELTIEYWYKGSNLQSGVRLQNGGDYIVAGWGLATNPQFIVSTDGGTGGVTIGSVTAIQDNNWHHIACVWKKNTIFATYLDGVLQNSRTAANVNLPVFSGINTYLGTYSGSGEFMNGSIDEVRIWNRALCLGEILNNKNGEIPTTANGLLANYHFNQGIMAETNTLVTSLTDASGNAYTGTLTNMALTGTVSNWIAPGGVVSGNTVVAFVSPTISVAGTSTVCSGVSTTLTASGGSTYSWVNGPTTNTYNFTPTTSAGYSVVGTNSLGCVSNMATFSITVNANPTITVNSGIICAGQTFTISPTGANTYTVQGGSNTVSPTSNSSYTITGTSSAGCISQNAATSNVTVNANPTITVNSGAICAGQTFTISPTGATTYTVQGGSNTVSPTSNSSYTITGTSSAGCVSQNAATSNVTVNANPTITANNGSVCAGQSFTIAPSGANTYTIQGGSNIVSPTANSSYTLRGTSSQGCLSQNTATSNVTVNANPTISVNSGAICAGQTFTISPTGANTYTVQGGSNIVSPTSNSSYTITGTSSAGCIAQNAATSNVTVNANPTISVNSGAICIGQSFIISPSGANTYTVQGGSTTVSPTSNTSYTISGTSSAGCISQNAATSNVTVNANPTITANNGSVCAGQSFTIAPSGANTYTIQGGSNIVSPTANASYTLRGTSSQGCLSQNTATSNITVNANPTISANSGSICVGQSFIISPSGANTYTVQGGSTTVSPTSNTSYTISGTSSAGCIAQNAATSNVTVNANPTITVNSGAICAGQTFTISPTGASTYTVQGGSNMVSPTSNSSYTISGTSSAGCISQNAATSNVTVNANPTITVNSGAICAGQTFTISPTGATTYTVQGGSNTVSPTSNSSYTISGTSSAGCVSQNAATSTVTVNANPTITVNSGAICAGQTFTISPSGANTYTVQGGSNTVSPTSNATYTVSGTSTAGCIAQNAAASNVTVNANPTISVNSGSICSGQTFTIVPSGANTYTVSGGSTTVTPLVNTAYSVTGTSSDGCLSGNTAVSSVTVNVTPTVSVNNGTICAGDSFTIVPSGAATYTVSGGSNVVNPTVTSSYSISGTSASGCNSALSINTVVVNPLPTVNASSSSGTICVGETATLSASGATAYVWNTSAASSSISVNPSITTVYTVTGSGSNGCSNSFTMSQEVSACTGLNALSEDEAAFRLYPNPNNGAFTIISKDNMTLTLMNELGQHIQTILLDESNAHSIQLREIAYGIYFIVGVNNNQFIKQKIIVNK